MQPKETGISRPRVIAFVGPVGAGKSTHVRLLASRFRKNGLKVKTTSLKTNHFFASALTLILAQMLVRKRKDVSRIRALFKDKPMVFRRLFRLWLSLDVISVSLQFLLTIYLPLTVGYTVLVEEYIPATIADYIYIGKAIGLPFSTRSFTSRFMLKLMHLGGPTQVIYLDADADTLKFRWNRRGSSNEKSDYLYMQHSTLLSLSKNLSSYEMLYVNSTFQTIEKTQRIITNHLVQTA